MPLRGQRWSNLTFAGALLVVLALFLWVIFPFLIPILIAAFLVVIAYPLRRRLTGKLGGRDKLASLLATLAVLLGIVVPAFGLAFVFVMQGIELANQAQEFLGPGGIPALLQGRVPEPLQPLFERLQATGLFEQIQNLMRRVGANLTSYLATFLGAAAMLGLDLFIALLAVYYFFLDGERVVRGMPGVLPLDPRYQAEFFSEFHQVAQTMIVVNLVTALAQGVLGAVGFMIAGIPTPVVWGALIALLALLPVVGSALVWGPAGAILLIQGQIGWGIFVLLWGLLVVGTVDNLLRPILAKGRIRLHTLLVFVTIFGGIAAFGFVGVVLGPLIGAIFTAMVRIWKRDFIPRLRASDG